MISRTTEQFRKGFKRLRPEVQRRAREAYRQFAIDPEHPSLQFKPIKRAPAHWSVRVSLGYRAIGRRDGDKIVWFFIGSHDDYVRVIAEL